MRKLLSILTIFAIGCFIGCGNVPGEPVANIKVNDLSKNTTVNYSVTASGSTRKIESFTPDDIDIIYIDDNCFDSFVDNGKIKHELICIELTDEFGNPIDAYSDTNLVEIMNCIKSVNHDFLNARIIKDGDLYLVLMELNVNWQSPTILYVFDGKNNTLTKLFSLDSIELLELEILR